MRITTCTVCSTFCSVDVFVKNTADMGPVRQDWHHREIKQSVP